MTSDRQTLHVLVSRYVTGELTELEGERLLLMLQDNIESQDLFRENVRLDWILRKRYDHLKKWEQAAEEEVIGTWDDNDWSMMLNWEQNAVPLVDSSVLPNNGCAVIEPPKEKQTLLESQTTKRTYASDKTDISKARWAFGPFFWVCLCLLVFVIGYSELQLRLHNTKGFEALAQIKEMVDPVWEGEKTYKRGQFVEADKIQLKSGTVYLEFVNGTRVILQGPSRFVVVNTKSAYCDLGRVFATVPPKASGFELVTPFGSIFDLGTEFFANVDSENATVGVVKGKVEWRTPSKTPLLLIPDTAIEANHRKETVSKVFSKEGIVDETVFNASLKRYVSQENEKKKREDILRDANPNLLARFDFSQWTGGPIANTSQRGMTLFAKAEVSGCRVGQGTLDGRNSICFTDRDDYAEAEIPGTFQTLTLTAMVRIDQLDHAGNVLLESRDFFNRSGTFLWQLTSEGMLQFHLYCGTEMSSVCSNSKNCVSRNDLGTWIKLTLIADGGRKTISHYVDDRLISATPWPHPIPIAPGALRIGNGKTKERRSTKNNRFFAGALSELVICDTAMTTETNGN